jgi:LCP family protein required for cell wall assembly
VSNTSPIRYPDTTDRNAMTTRAWWLVGLNLLLPGSSQSLAGNHRLGRFGLGATITLWVALAIGAALYVFFQPALFAIGTNVIALWIIQAALVFYAVLWVILTFDTIRLVRFVRTAPAARGFIAAFVTVTLLVVAGTAGYGAMLAGATRTLVADVFTTQPALLAVNGRYNILLLGGDAGPDRLGLRPDSISVVSVDAETGVTTVVGIPRNLEQAPFSEGSPLYGEFPNGYDCGDECLVSYLYTYGQEHSELYPDAEANGSNAGIEAMRDAAEGILGIELQYYVLIDMQGFSDLIDALGGIDIVSTGRYPIGGGEDANGQPIDVNGWIEPGGQHMDGFIALWYARARHGTNDYDRMARQRQVQEAILAQFEPANVLTKLQSVAEAGAEVITTDIPQASLGYFVRLAEKARALPIAKIELVPENGVDVLDPNFEEIHALIDAALAPTNDTPTPEP